MPEVLGNPPSPRVALFWNGAAWQWALVDAAGHLQIDTVTTALPVGAATAANQVIINTTVGLVALIRNALQSVATDRLKVRGEDQLFSIKDSLIARVGPAAAAVGDNTLNSIVCPAGEWWVVTHVIIFNQTSAITRMETYAAQGAQFSMLNVALAPAQYEANVWDGTLVLKQNGRVRGVFIGCIAGDLLYLDIHGYKMTLET